MISTIRQSNPADQWAAAFKDYFLGFIAQDELESTLRSLFLAYPELKDPELRTSKFQSDIEHLLAPEDKSHKYILDRIRRRFFIDLQELSDHARSTHRQHIYRTKDLPDNCTVVDLGDNRFDVKCLEESGFVHHRSCLISRTIQPFLRYTADGKLVEDRPVTEPLAVIIPKQTELRFYENFPFQRTFNQDGVVYTGIFTPISLSARFIHRSMLRVRKALVCVAYKTALIQDPEVPYIPVKTDYLKRVISPHG